MSINTTSGSSLGISFNAVAPLANSPTSLKPGARLMSVERLLRMPSSSSTMATLICISLKTNFNYAVLRSGSTGDSLERPSACLCPARWSLPTGRRRPAARRRMFPSPLCSPFDLVEPVSKPLPSSAMMIFNTCPSVLICRWTTLPPECFKTLASVLLDDQKNVVACVRRQGARRQVARQGRAGSGRRNFQTSRWQNA